jgi:hypothetical protein
MVAFGIINVEWPVILNSAYRQILVLKVVAVMCTVFLVSDASFWCVSEDSSLTLLDMGNKDTEAGVPYHTPAEGDCT